MQDASEHARAAAFWMLHAACLAKLLRAHGSEAHACNLEAAMNEAAEIISREVGRQTLAQAIDWATDQLYEDDIEPPDATVMSRH